MVRTPACFSTSEVTIYFSTYSAPPKGKLFKGTPFGYLKTSVEDKARIQDMMSALEENNQQILLQKLEIRSLKDQIIKILEERGGNAHPTENVMVGRYGGTVPQRTTVVGPASQN